MDRLKESSGSDSGISAGKDCSTSTKSADASEMMSSISSTRSNSSWSQEEAIVIKRRTSKATIRRELSVQEKVPHFLASQETFEVHEMDERAECAAIERSNLIKLIKLVVKHLIETAMKQNRHLDFNEVPFNHFFTLLEHVMRHGLKTRKGILSSGSRRELWHVLETVEHFMPEAVDLTSSIRDLPNVRTSMGRARAWLRLAFVQKRLPDYFQTLADQRRILRDLYEPDALMMNEEAVVVGGLLIGLNIIDCNDWCVKDENLDFQLDLIDFSFYLKDNTKHNFTDDSSNGEESGPGDMQTVLDQKNYMEEMNRHLSATISNLHKKIEQLESGHKISSKKEVVFENENDSSLSAFGGANKWLEENGGKSSPSSSDFEKKENMTSCSEENGGEEKLLQEKHEKDRLQKDLNIQTSIRNEMETAMKLLEKDIHEKQDTIISLRRQLEDIKAINLQMYNKLQECEKLLKSRNEQIGQLEHKTTVLTNTITQLESRLVNCEKRRTVYEEANQRLSEQMVEREQKRVSVEGDLKIEREWRVSLKTIVDEQQMQITALEADLEESRSSSSDYHSLKKEFLRLQKKCSEYELTLEEIGVQLRDSRLEMDSLKEGLLPKDLSWRQDKDACDCYQCGKAFSVARRKHHCRNCGQIFCGPCSDNKLPLPSSAKPVRVCDICHPMLLERYSAS